MTCLGRIVVPGLPHRVTQRGNWRQRAFFKDGRGRDIEELIAVVEVLAEQGALPAAYRPHRLTGESSGVWECHIEPDWLLIYTVTDEEVLLIRTGTHDDLFD